MTDRQAKAFCWATELAMTQQPVTLSVTEAREVSAGMQRLHTENTTLQQGYAAARLEIESLKAQLAERAKEHADELTVAYMCGASREKELAAQQPSPSAASKAVLAAIRAANMQLVRTGDDAFMLVTYKQATPQADSQPAQPAPQQEAQYNHGPQAETVAEAARDVGKWLNERPNRPLDLRHVAMLCAHAQAAPQADSVLEDAARLDWLLLHISGAEFRRIGVHYSGNARRADVDAARKQGANHD